MVTGLLTGDRLSEYASLRLPACCCFFHSSNISVPRDSSRPSCHSSRSEDCDFSRNRISPEKQSGTSLAARTHVSRRPHCYNEGESPHPEEEQWGQSGSAPARGCRGLGGWLRGP
eukprot:754652-Hanusia_phi.AAC.4